jgi:transposase
MEDFYMSNKKGTKSNMKSFEEKLKIAQDWNQNPIPWKELGAKYNVSYSRARIWALGYQENGEQFLKDISTRKGQRAGISKGKTYRNNNINPDKREIAKLRKELKEKEMEIEILKKWNDFVEDIDNDK